MFDKDTLPELMKTPAKSKKFNDFSDKYKSITKAMKCLEKLDSNKYLLTIIHDLKQEQAVCQEEMAKMLDTVYRAMRRESKKAGQKLKKNMALIT